MVVTSYNKPLETQLDETIKNNIDNLVEQAAHN